MSGFMSLSCAEQVAMYLRGEISSGKLHGVMSGVLLLEAELGVNRKTVETAFRLLEAEGILLPQGRGKRRLIRAQKVGKSWPLRVAILAGEFAETKLDYLVDLRHKLNRDGHHAEFVAKSMMELGMDVNRIAWMVEKTEADAWVVISGSVDVLEWFSEREIPVFALFGRRRGFSIAGGGPNMPPAYAEVTRTLIQYGHRRIVLLARRRQRLPVPGASEQMFLDELTAHRIKPTPYHLPDWDVTIDGFYDRLGSLFQFTPPTALIVEDAPFFVAALQFCANKGLQVPKEVSLVCTNGDPAFDWCKPSVAHISWDSRPLVRRIVKWASNVSQCKKDVRQTLTPARFVPGGTIGPVAGK
jgi:DNA-binding LacI/PurR family transcriptional regulator